MTILMALAVFGTAHAVDVPASLGLTSDDAPPFSRLIDIPFDNEPDHVVNGERTDDFPEVVALVAHFGNWGDQVFCSGTIISDRWVLTAAHCVLAVSQFQEYGADLYIAVGGGDILQNGTDEFIEWKAYYAHPDYNSSTISADIGLIELRTKSETTPAVLNDEAPGASWIDAPFTYVGFGITGDNRNDGGVKRTADINVREWSDELIYGLDPDYNLCSGDSGGASYEATEAGFELAGVNSFVYSWYDSNHVCEGGGSGATRVDAFMDWIVSYTDVTTEYPPEPEPEDTAVTDTGTQGEPSGTHIVVVTTTTGFGCSALAPTTSFSPLFVLFGLIPWRRRRAPR